MNFFTKALFATALALAAPTAAMANCPSFGVSGAGLSYDSDQVWTPRAHQVVAGGNLDLSRCGSVPGVGYIVTNPDFTMQYRDLGRGRALEFRVEGSCDTVLLVNSATGQWFFNDDDNGMNPRLRLSGAPSGQYDIWIGTYNPSTCNARLIVESF